MSNRNHDNDSIQEDEWGGGGFQSYKDAHREVQAGLKADFNRSRAKTLALMVQVIRGEISKQKFKKLTGSSFDDLMKNAKWYINQIKRMPKSKLAPVAPAAPTATESVDMDIQEATPDNRIMVYASVANKAAWTKIEKLMASLDSWHESDWNGQGGTAWNAWFAFDAKKHTQDERKKVAEFLKNTPGVKFHHAVKEDIQEAEKAVAPNDDELRRLLDAAKEILYGKSKFGYFDKDREAKKLINKAKKFAMVTRDRALQAEWNDMNYHLKGIKVRKPKPNLNRSFGGVHDPRSYGRGGVADSYEAEGDDIQEKVEIDGRTRMYRETVMRLEAARKLREQRMKAMQENRFGGLYDDGSGKGAMVPAPVDFNFHEAMRVVEKYRSLREKKKTLMGAPKEDIDAAVVMKGDKFAMSETELSPKQKEFRAFFKKALQKFGKSSPAKMDDAEKKKFFNWVEKNWKG